MGMRMPETCWAVFKRQAIKLRDWCIWLVDLSEDKKCSICSINPRYIWYIRRFGDYFSFLPSNWFNRICFEAYFDRKCRVHEVNICTAILCLTAQCDTVHEVNICTAILCLTAQCDTVHEVNICTAILCLTVQCDTVHEVNFCTAILCLTAQCDTVHEVNICTAILCLTAQCDTVHEVDICTAILCLTVQCDTVHEVNICTAILCLTVQWHRATYSLVRLPASIFKEKDWWRCKIEAADRPEGLAKPIGLQGEFITDTPLRRWSCTLTGNVLLHRATDLRVVSLTRTVAKQMEVTRTNCKYVTCQK